MSNVTYINTHEIRQDLMGFLRQIDAGRDYIVLNRSKRVASLTSLDKPATPNDAQQNMQKFLTAAEAARNSAAGTLDPQKSYKEVYAEDMAKDYALSGH